MPHGNTAFAIMLILFLLLLNVAKNPHTVRMMIKDQYMTFEVVMLKESIYVKQFFLKKRATIIDHHNWFSVNSFNDILFLFIIAPF